MNIDKAIRKQKKSYERFVLAMCFIFFILPMLLIVSKKIYIFYIIYLIIIELLIVLAIFIKASKELLHFKYDGYKLIIEMGLIRKKINIICEKITLVHVEDIFLENSKEKNFKIILLATSKFRSDRMILVNKNFFKNHPYVAHKYNKFKSSHPEHIYFYTIIKRGGLNKYPLLNLIYKSCVYAEFTEEAIEKIKFYRNNSEEYKVKNN